MSDGGAGRRGRAGALLLVLAGTLALTACSGSNTQVDEQSDGRVTVQGHGDQAQVTVHAEQDGQVTYNLHRVPAGFPDAVPRPGLRLVGATAAAHGDQRSYQLSYALGGAGPRAALGDYATRLGRAGFSVDAIDGPSSDTTPSPLRATGPDWRVVAVATRGSDAGSMIVTVDNG